MWGQWDWLERMIGHKGIIGNEGTIGHEIKLEGTVGCEEMI